jgi:hypothetical protein
VNSFSQIPHFASRAEAETWFRQYFSAGTVKVVFWPEYDGGRSDDFHWAVAGEDGRWYDKPGQCPVRVHSNWMALLKVVQKSGLYDIRDFFLGRCNHTVDTWQL